MAFVWKHKGVVLVLVAIVGYWYLNPADRFGLAAENLVIHDRTPIPYFDLYITPAGRRILFEDLARTADLAALCDSLARLSAYHDDKPVVLLVGRGFGENPRLSLAGEQRCGTIPLSMEVTHLPSQRAVRRYNELRDKGDAVAIVLRVKD
jgi:hypothetical protein